MEENYLNQNLTEDKLTELKSAWTILGKKICNLSQNAKRASARKDTGLDQSLFSVQLFRLRINIIKVCIRDQIRAI